MPFLSLCPHSASFPTVIQSIHGQQNGNQLHCPSFSLPLHLSILPPPMGLSETLLTPFDSINLAKLKYIFLADFPCQNPSFRVPNSPGTAQIFMKFFRLPSGDHQKNNKNSHQMGQFSSSEVQAASAVAGKAVLSTASAIGADNAGEMRAAAAGGAKQERAHSLAAAPFRPSQPIDILGKARHRSEVVQYGKMPMPMPPQREMQQHQPRVIQPRRLNAIPSASLGPMRGANGREELGGGNYRERIWQEAMRRRLLSLDSRPVDPECPSVSGDNNKENDEQRLGGKQLSRSRKRLNSAELEYSGNGTESEMEQMELAKEGGEGQEEMPLRNSLDSGSPERGKQPKEGARKAAAGRIAYLYGVYGQQECAPYSQLLFPKKPQMMEENIFSGQRQPQLAKGGWVDCCWGDEGGRQSLQRQIHFGQQFCSDSEDECLELDGELEDEPVERLARLHSVSDIIGYAKVVRAQRQETLCRLDDVMSQFDALIRSYSMAIKGKTAVENEPEMKNAQPAPGLTAPIVQSKAITN